MFFCLRGGLVLSAQLAISHDKNITDTFKTMELSRLLPADSLKSYFELLKIRNFSLLFFGQLVSLAGDRLTYIVLPLYMYENTGSAAYMGIVFAVENLPWIVISPVLSIYLSKYNKKILMLICDAARCMVCVGLFYWDNIYYILLASFLLGTFSSLFFPIRTAFLPGLVSKKQLPSAIGFLYLSSNMMSIAGPLMAGILLSIYPSKMLFFIDSFTYIFSFSLLVFIVYEKGAIIDTEDSLSFIREIKGIFLTIKTKLKLKLAVFSESVNSFAEGLTEPVILLLITNEFLLSNSDYGYILFSLSLGAMVGTLFSSKLDPQINGLRYLISACTLMMFTFLVITFKFKSIWLLFLIWFVHGIGKGIFGNSITVLMTVFCPPNQRQKVFSLSNSVIATCVLLGNVLSGYVTDNFGIKVNFYIGSIGMILLVFMLVKSFLAAEYKKL